MKALFVFTLIVISWIISDVVGKYNARLGEIFGMAMVQPLLLVFLFIVLAILYIGCREFFQIGKKEKANINDSEYSNVVNEEKNIFFEKSIISNDLIEYKFFKKLINKKESTLWKARCNLIQGKIQSIILYADDTYTEAVIQIKKEIVGLEYLVIEGRSIAGRIKITDQGLSYIDIDNEKTYSANLETKVDEGLGAVADWLLALDTLWPYSSASTYNYLVLKVENDETLGRFYIHLRNIDLTADTNDKIDIRIAVVFSIFIDNKWNKLENGEASK